MSLYYSIIITCFNFWMEKTNTRGSTLQISDKTVSRPRFSIRISSSQGEGMRTFALFCVWLMFYDFAGETSPVFGV